MKGSQGSRPLARLGYLAVAGVLFATGVVLSYAYDFQIAVERRLGNRTDTLVYVPIYRPQTGPQILFVYVGSSKCPWSNQPEMPEAIQAIKRRLADVASARGVSFKALGIALDWSTRRGVEHLAKFGFFDEIAAGYNWGNSVGMRYLGLDDSVPPATPVALVYSQRFVEVAPQDSGAATIYEERDRRLVLAKLGAWEIAAWADSGAPLPQIDLAGVPGEDSTDFEMRVGRALATTNNPTNSYRRQR